MIGRSVVVCVLAVAAPVGAHGSQLECPTAQTAGDPVLVELEAALYGENKDDVRRRLDALEPTVRLAATAEPDGVEAQYRLAALLGVRADREGGRRRIGAANELHTQAMGVLALDPDHAGAHYLLGRLYVAVMRLDGLTRFLARRLLGGKALDAASWERGLAHLEAAERLAPCDPAHHVDLARAYHDREDTIDADRELQHALALTINQPRWAHIHAKAERLAATWTRRPR